jgi:tetrahydromethanopterin S-methyltransferase subunit G
VSTDRRLDEIELRHKQRYSEQDLRYQQRFEQQGAALQAAAASTDRRLDEIELRHKQLYSESDLRYQQRFDQQGTALEAAAVAATQAVAAAIDSAEKAVSKSDVSNEKRFDAVNELRTQIRDQATTFIPRHETEQRLSLISARIDELRSSDAQRSGRTAGSSALYGWIVGGIAALATMVAIASALFK